MHAHTYSLKLTPHETDLRFQICSTYSWAVIAFLCILNVCGAVSPAAAWNKESLRRRLTSRWFCALKL